MSMSKSPSSHWLRPTFCFFSFLCFHYGYNDVNINVQTDKVEFDYFNVPQILILSIGTGLAPTYFPTYFSSFVLHMSHSTLIYLYVVGKNYPRAFGHIYHCLY